MQNLANSSQLFVISFHLLRLLGTLVFSLILNFPSLAMSGIFVRLVLFISGILSDSKGISCVKLLFWLQTPSLEVFLITVIPCFEVSLFLIFTGSSVFKTMLLELRLIPPSTHISLL